MANRQAQLACPPLAAGVGHRKIVVARVDQRQQAVACARQVAMDGNHGPDLARVKYLVGAQLPQGIGCVVRPGVQRRAHSIVVEPRECQPRVGAWGREAQACKVDGGAGPRCKARGGPARPVAAQGAGVLLVCRRSGVGVGAAVALQGAGRGKQVSVSKRLLHMRA